MLLAPAMLNALVNALAAPRNGAYRIHGGRVYLRDKADVVYRAVVLKNGVISTTGEVL